MGIYSLGQHVPRIHETAWIAKSAKVIGRVAMAENSSVWFGAVVRGDVEDIRIGRNTNIQDNSVLRADSGNPAHDRRECHGRPSRDAPRLHGRRRRLDRHRAVMLNAARSAATASSARAA
jgi:hypothetical protein